MRNLTQPRVLTSAGIAALATAAACYPRLALWSQRLDPVWYLEAVAFLCSFVLWGFVFAWHTAYTGRPVFTLKLNTPLFALVTFLGLLTALFCRLLLDPLLRTKMPAEFPADFAHWAALLLFSLALGQLFLIFAPFAWLVRLLRNQRMAIFLTVLWGGLVLALKINSSPARFSPLLLAVLLTGRIVAGFLLVLFYLRGGVLLSWWWTILIEARHLPDLLSAP